MLRALLVGGGRLSRFNGRPRPVRALNKVESPSRGLAAQPPDANVETLGVSIAPPTPAAAKTGASLQI